MRSPSWWTERTRARVSSCARCNWRRRACRRGESWRMREEGRFVGATAPADLPAFEAICTRERCPVAVVGVATDERQLQLIDDTVEAATPEPVDMPMEVL